jgi:hypothetical protein
MSDVSVAATREAAGMFDQVIDKIGARTLLFNTWPRQPNSKWYVEKDTKYLKSPKFMEGEFTYMTGWLAKELGATPIPVGPFWMSVLTQYPTYPLYHEDGSHPSPAGSYLTALVFYRYLSGRNPDKVTYAPEGVPAEPAQYLRNAVRW